MNLSERIKSIKTSMTLAIAAQAKEMTAKGLDVISLSAGEPDFSTPQTICNAAKNAIDLGATHYTAVGGTIELRQAIVDKLERDNQLSYSPDQIIVSNGAKQSISNALAALINPGDEVIIPVPYWVSYPEMVNLFNGKPVLCQPSHPNSNKPSAADLEACINANTKLIILNSPSNPTGCCYLAEELKAIGLMLQKHPHIYVITDDIYEYLIWGDEPFCNLVMACPELKDRVLVVNGVSKGYAMTGWRIGYAAGCLDWINGMRKYQSQTTSCPSSISQHAATAAMTCPAAEMDVMYEQLKKRHDLFVHGLKTIPGVDAADSMGTFYTFPNVTKIIEKLGYADDLELAKALLHDQLIAVVPGSAFGAPGHIRMSFATSDELLEKALERLHQFVNQS